MIYDSRCNKYRFLPYIAVAPIILNIDDKQWLWSWFDIIYSLINCFILFWICYWYQRSVCFLVANMMIHISKRASLPTNFSCYCGSSHSISTSSISYSVRILSLFPMSFSSTSFCPVFPSTNVYEPNVYEWKFKQHKHVYLLTVNKLSYLAVCIF